MISNYFKIAYRSFLKNKIYTMVNITGLTLAMAVFIKLVTSDFIKLVTISFIIAIPITYYFIKKWLQGFAYGIEIDFWVFFVVFILATFLTVLTVSYQSIKTAFVNPAKTLRSE